MEYLLIAEKWAEIMTDSWEIAENLTENGNFPGKIPEKPKIVEFPRFKRIGWEIQMHRKYPVRNCQKFA